MARLTVVRTSHSQRSSMLRGDATSPPARGAARWPGASSAHGRPGEAQCAAASMVVVAVAVLAAAAAVVVPQVDGDGDKHRSAAVALEGDKRRRVPRSPRSARGEAQTELLAGVLGRGVLCCGIVVGDCCRLPTTPTRLGVLF